jgi:hypothetical protein
MRIRILQKPSIRSIDGLRLDRFEPGHQYEVGNSLGALLLAEGWGEPVSVRNPPPHPAVIDVVPASAQPKSVGEPKRPAVEPAAKPRNPIREIHRPTVDTPPPAVAAKRNRRKR